MKMEIRRIDEQREEKVRKKKMREKKINSQAFGIQISNRFWNGETVFEMFLGTLCQYIFNIFSTLIRTMDLGN